jgi:DNA recombination protein RmuC
MQNLTLILPLAVILILAIGGLAFYISSQIKNLTSSMKSDENTVLLEWLREMKNSVDKNSETLEKQLKDQRVSVEDQLKAQRVVLNQQTKLIWERLDNASDVIRNVQKQIGGIQEFGNDIKDLSNILKSPKMRGGLGEQFLYEILGNLLPNDMFKTQYRFKDGNICDAIVITEKGLIPIDSKFPMERFKVMFEAETPELREKARKGFIAAAKERIDEISSKYILPTEGTTEQAIMYIPSENVYYELIVNTPEIEDYAKHKNVVMASPNTISYFLKVLLVAFQQHELQKHAGDILKSLSGIKIEAEKFGGDLDVLEGHISNTYKSMDKIRGKFTKLFGKIESASAIGEGDSAPELPAAAQSGLDL